MPVYEERHCYVLLKMTLSEPINPALDPRMGGKAGEISRNAVKTMPANFPNVENAVSDFRNAVYGIMNNIIMEYTAMYQDDGEKEQANSPPTTSNINMGVTG